MSSTVRSRRSWASRMARPTAAATSDSRLPRPMRLTSRGLLAMWFALLAAAGSSCLAETTPAFPGAEGFGAASRGGSGGKRLEVTSLDDDPRQPQPGTLRWAVQQAGPRIVRFACAGNIRLKEPLAVSEPFLTIDGRDAPGDGVCLADHCLHLKRTHDVIVRFIRIRRGDVTTLE